nr:TetR/AcrR family transcriptional regulator [Oricola nitratireducens]
MLFDIVHAHLTDLIEAVEAVPVVSDATEALNALCAAILATYRDADAEHKLQLDTISALPEDQQRELKDQQRHLIAIMADAIRATAPELFASRPELLKPAAMSAFGMLNWFYMWHREGSGISRDAYAGLITDFILGGLDRIASGKSGASKTESVEFTRRKSADR